MPSPWDDKQKPNEKSPFHGKKDKDHNEHEHGGGALKEDKLPKVPKLEEFLTTEAPNLINVAALPDTDMAAGFLNSYVIPSVPPIKNQGTTPQCVAYASAYDQAHMDRAEAGKFLDFDEGKFFYQIGGSSAGASISRALEQRKDFGYPVVNVGNRGAHRISAYYQVDLTINAIKSAIKALPNNGGVLVIGPWYHSWQHPLASGKLPAPDYFVFGHCTEWIGWDDDLGFLIHNSWGKDFGKDGNCYLPYTYVKKMWNAFRTKDR